MLFKYFVVCPFTGLNIHLGANTLQTSLIVVAHTLGAPTGLETRQSCSDFKLIHMAGTTEVGLGIVGTPLAAALASAVPGYVCAQTRCSDYSQFAL